MQQKRPPNHPRTWLSSFLLIGLVLCLSRSAHAGDCWGAWRFEVAEPSQEQDSFVAPQRWCQAAELPRALSVEVKRIGESVSLTGTPLRPADVMQGGGKCEFIFSEGEGGVPKNHELAIEVNGSGAIVKGTARCTAKQPAHGEARGGTSIRMEVTGNRLYSSDAGLQASRAPSDVPDMDPRPAAVLAACKQREGEVLWKMMSPRFRSEVNRRAAQLRRSLPASDLKEIYRYTGSITAFTGSAYLRQVVKRPGSFDNPCSDAEQWEVGEGAVSAGKFVVPIRRKDGFAFAMSFIGKVRAWKLDQISKATRKSRP